MKRLIIVTGASRGIGEAVADQLNRFFNKDSLILLLARDLEKLNTVRNKLAETSSNNAFKVIRTDFAAHHSLSDYYEILKEALKDYNLNEFESLISVYNHGTLEFGDISLKAQENLAKIYEINLFSIWSLIGAISRLIPADLVKDQIHVNISSGYAHEPCANWSGHCTVRAARDMLFKCLALEQVSFKVLNYEPGLVNTDMMKQAIEIEPAFQAGLDEGKYAKPEDTARYLVQVLAENNFPSGGKVKYSGSSE